METHPIGTHFNNIWLPIFILAKWLMPGSASKGIAVFEDREIMYRRVGQCLLVIVSNKFNEGRKG